MSSVESFFWTVGVLVSIAAVLLLAWIVFQEILWRVGGAVRDYFDRRNEAFLERHIRCELKNCARWFGESKEASAAFDAVSETVSGDRLRPSEARDKWRQECGYNSNGVKSQ